MSILIPIDEVVRRTSISRREIYARMKRGTFPRSVKVGGARVAWVDEEVDEFVQNRIAERDETTGTQA
jgi:prophage regulatory protein